MKKSVQLVNPFFPAFPSPPPPRKPRLQRRGAHYIDQETPVNRYLKKWMEWRKKPAAPRDRRLSLLLCKGPSPGIPGPSAPQSRRARQ